MSLSIAAPAATPPAATALKGDAASNAGFAAVSDIVVALSKPGTYGREARTDLGAKDVGGLLGQARTAAELLNTGSQSGDRWLSRNAGFALESTRQGIQELEWLDDVLSNFKEPTQAAIDMKFEDAHKAFSSARDAYGLE